MRLRTCCVVSFLDDFGGQVGKVGQSGVLRPEPGNNHYQSRQNNPIKPNLDVYFERAPVYLGCPRLTKSCCAIGTTFAYGLLNKFFQQIKYETAPVPGDMWNRNARRRSTNDPSPQSLHLQPCNRGAERQGPPLQR